MVSFRQFRGCAVGRGSQGALYEPTAGMVSGYFRKSFLSWWHPSAFQMWMGGASSIPAEGQETGGGLGLTMHTKCRRGTAVKLFFLRNPLKIKVQPPRLERGTF